MSKRSKRPRVEEKEAESDHAKVDMLESVGSEGMEEEESAAGEAEAQTLEPDVRGEDESETEDEEDDGEAVEERREVKRRMRMTFADSGTHQTVKYDGSYRNKQRVLAFCSRGVTSRYRHLLEDLRKLMPHHKKDVKLDCKGDLQVINEIAEIKSCNNCVFLEARKRQDLYLWMAKTPLGPSVKFHVLNVHTTDELRMTGNAMIGSRPLLSFDAAFDDADKPHLQLIKALLLDVFNCPRGHPKSKPFIDRIMAFCIADGKIWMRNYQIVDVASGDKKAQARAALKGEDLTNLVEIGPRFVLNPIRVFGGSFGGPTLYQNPQFVSPNFVRAERKKAAGTALVNRMAAKEASKAHREKAVMPTDAIADIFRQSV